MDEIAPNVPFGASYYATGCGSDYVRNDGWLSFFGQIADCIVREIRPATALDAGCAMGFLVETLRERGVQAWGLDISDYAISQAHPSIRDYCAVGSITQPFARRYDLIVCIEVLEHLPKADGQRAIANLCAHADDILFSSTPDDYAEATHVNIQQPDYWAEQFAHQGFFRDLDFDASFITPWAARFRKRSESVPRIVREYERRMWQLQQENQQLRQAFTEARADGEVEALRTERDALRQLVAQYEQGKFIRFMRWWRGIGRGNGRTDA